MLIFNAEEQRFSEEKRGEQHEDSLLSLRKLCDLCDSILSELKIQHQLLDVGHGDSVLLDRF